MNFIDQAVDFMYSNKTVACCECGKPVKKKDRSKIAPWTPIHHSCHVALIDKSLSENPHLKEMYRKELSTLPWNTGYKIK